MFKLPEFKIRKVNKQSKSVAKRVDESVRDTQRENTLRELEEIRKDIAQQTGRFIKPEYIFSQQTLEQMAEKLPRTYEEMLEVEGVTVAKWEKYGPLFLEVWFLCFKIS